MQLKSSITFNRRRINREVVFGCHAAAAFGRSLLLSSLSMTLQWRIIDDDALEFRRWDDEVVVYNGLSGDTHLLDASTAEILLALRHTRLDMLSLAQLLARKWQCEPTPDFLDELEMTLSNMHALSLVERD